MKTVLENMMSLSGWLILVVIIMACYTSLYGFAGGHVTPLVIMEDIGVSPSHVHRISTNYDWCDCGAGQTSIQVWIQSRSTHRNNIVVKVHLDHVR